MKELALKIVKDAIEDHHSIDRQVYGSTEVFTMCVVKRIDNHPESISSVIQGKNIEECVKYHCDYIKNTLNDLKHSQGLSEAQILECLAIGHPMYKTCGELPEEHIWELIELGLSEFYKEIYC